MRIRILLFLILAVVPVLTGCGSETTISQAAPPPVRTLSVNGVGEVRLAPDIAYLYIGVHTDMPSAAEAVATNNEQTTALTAALKEAGVDAKDISTSNFGIWPNTQYSPEGKSIGTTYIVDNTVYIAVRDLEGLGDLLDAAIGAGANSINSITFDVADKSKALKEARAKAVENARAQAQELAGLAGVELGAVQSVAYYESVPSPFIAGKGGGGGAGGDGIGLAVPIQPGQLSLIVTASMVYEIK